MIRTSTAELTDSRTVRCPRRSSSWSALRGAASCTRERSEACSPRTSSVPEPSRNGLPEQDSSRFLRLAGRLGRPRPGVILRAYPAATIGALTIAELLAPSQTAAALSAVTAVAVTVFLRAPHVPAALCAGGIGLADPGFAYLWQTLVPALVIVLLGAEMAGRIVPGFSYPPEGARRLWGPVELDRILRFRMRAQSK